MATATNKPPKAEKLEGFVGFIKKTMGASKQLSLTAVNLPYMFLESMGIPEEKTAGMKNFNTKFVSSVYKGPDWVVEKLSGSKAEKEPPKKVEKKAVKKTVKKVETKAAKKTVKKAAPKKATKAKKEPPKVAAKKPAPVAAATKEAA